MLRVLRGVVAAGVVMMIGVASAPATTGSGVTVEELGRGTVDTAFRIETDGPSDVVVIKARVEPGADTGWHSHSGSEVALVQAGTLTYYDGDDQDCTPQPLEAGQARVERPGHVHLTRNEGSTPVEVYAAFVVPQGRPLRIDADRSSHCPF